jgi:hypothetical protein
MLRILSCFGQNGVSHHGFHFTPYGRQVGAAVARAGYSVACEWMQCETYGYTHLMIRVAEPERSTGERCSEA